MVARMKKGSHWMNVFKLIKCWGRNWKTKKEKLPGWKQMENDENESAKLKFSHCIISLNITIIFLTIFAKLSPIRQFFLKLKLSYSHEIELAVFSISHTSINLKSTKHAFNINRTSPVEPKKCSENLEDDLNGRWP